MTRRALLLCTVLFAASGAGCQKRGEPEDAVWGKQPCEHCQMLVSHRASAAQLVLDGERYYFDDLGCMIQWLDERHRTARAWVVAGAGWVDAGNSRRGKSAKPQAA